MPKRPNKECVSMVDSNNNQNGLFQIMYRFCSANEKMKKMDVMEKQIFTFKEYAFFYAALKFIKHYCNCLKTTADKNV